MVYSRNPEDLKIHSEPGVAIGQGLIEKFGKGRIRLDNYTPSGDPFDFPVLQSDGRIISSSLLSDLLSRIPLATIDFVFVDPDIRDEARRFVIENRKDLLAESTA